MRLRFSWLLCLLACGAPGRPAARPSAAQAPRPPRLIVQITVDQLRGDLLERHADRYGPGGLARFLEGGLVYTAAHYAHAATETAVGHATLFSGALPRDHGVVANDWYDPAQGRSRAAVEDPGSHLLGHPDRAGASPRALRATTLGDQLRLASGGTALVFGASIKDRAAIFSAGHGGKAVWFDDESGAFVSSDYYYATMPSWLVAFNALRLADAYKGQSWELLLPADAYRAPAELPYARSYGQLGHGFPHALGSDGGASFYRTLKRTPFADELTSALVEALFEAEPLGRDAVPDLLAISFSATDYIGHVFGPESREAEDDLLRLDRVLARLFGVLLRRVPERELLIVLSSDHGAPDSPEHLQRLGVPAGRHDVVALLARLNDALEQRFGQGNRFVLEFVNPALWLDEAAIAHAGLSVETVEQALVELVQREPGFALALARSDLARGSVPPGAAQERVQNSFDRERSGHVYLVPQPGWLLAGDAAQLGSMHGSPHAYDTHVPIAFWGHGVRAARVSRRVDPRDIAVTLAALLRVNPPSAASGTPLAEVLE
jgi:hypothetical protein